MLDAIIVIVQYAHDQAMGSARDQAAKVSLRHVDHYHGEHTPSICLESSKNGISSCRIAILHLPDNYNCRVGLQTSVGGARMHCMYATDTYSLTILATSLRWRDTVLMRFMT